MYIDLPFQNRSKGADPTVNTAVPIIAFISSSPDDISNVNQPEALRGCRMDGCVMLRQHVDTQITSLLAVV
ncbi:Hypothetical predicted protein [Scomber scombrus]|uniref:Uncharacterized protein n=1 Tax=Scomber scombrus TaxID=13677 RepID=A0AAV1PIU5_SCOSC